MKDSTAKTSLARFEQCQTIKECNAVLKELCQPFYEVTTRLKKERSARAKAIRTAELEPFHELASRFRRGQKVFFATALNSVALGWDLRSIKGSEKKIEAGQWCRVWEYQPRAKRLWLCRPGKAATYANVITDPFSLRDMKDHGISRTELAVR